MKRHTYLYSVKTCQLAIIFIFLTHCHLFAQDIESKMRAIFIYNIAKNINWPESAPKGDFVIGIVGDNSIAGELDKMISNTTTHNGRTTIVKKIAASHAVGVIENYHILYFSTKETQAMQPIITNATKLPVLLIGEKADNSCKGSTLCFSKDTNNKLRLELHKLSLEQHRLKATNDLLRIATVIDN
ncbi:YfiR family protein [Cytophagaceae bacterium YF14B1]|uniref:YfiR family protein n=1 Tax=Xanthocytophaga flava TaxID=3048013 RepID=A0AAE3QZ90_9BACT|nr:YfiR family protein [Xanthocytophaga flavus]MDJ1485243.1 YfiR family protein [Xanthocytophaga flavus]